MMNSDFSVRGLCKRGLATLVGDADGQSPVSGFFREKVQRQ